MKTQINTIMLSLMLSGAAVAMDPNAAGTLASHAPQATVIPNAVPPGFEVADTAGTAAPAVVPENPLLTENTIGEIDGWLQINQIVSNDLTIRAASAIHPDDREYIMNMINRCNFLISQEGLGAAILNMGHLSAYADGTYPAMMLNYLSTFTRDELKRIDRLYQASPFAGYEDAFPIFVAFSAIPENMHAQIQGDVDALNLGADFAGIANAIWDRIYAPIVKKGMHRLTRDTLSFFNTMLASDRAQLMLRFNRMHLFDGVGPNDRHIIINTVGEIKAPDRAPVLDLIAQHHLLDGVNPYQRSDIIGAVGNINAPRREAVFTPEFLQRLQAAPPENRANMIRRGR